MAASSRRRVCKHGAAWCRAPWPRPSPLRRTTHHDLHLFYDVTPALCALLNRAIKSPSCRDFWRGVRNIFHVIFARQDRMRLMLSERKISTQHPHIAEYEFVTTLPSYGKMITSLFIEIWYRILESSSVWPLLLSVPLSPYTTVCKHLSVIGERAWNNTVQKEAVTHSLSLVTAINPFFITLSDQLLYLYAHVKCKIHWHETQILPLAVPQSKCTLY